MLYLNWIESSICIEITSHPTLQTQLKIKVGQNELTDLLASLEETFLKQAGELRVQLPQNWVLYWKLREEGSRALLAHPEPEEWVGTIALELALAQKLFLSLKNLKSGQSFYLSQVGILGSVSNLELAFTI